MDMRLIPSSLTGSRAPSEVTVPLSLPLRERTALLAGASQSLHVARNATKARVWLVEWPKNSDQHVVLKDGSNRALWFRVLIGRYQMKREWKALGFLNGMQGVPRPYFWAGADAFGMELCSGESLLHFAPGELPTSAVEGLESVMNEMHARGVTHGDLHRDNILYDAASDHVWLIDWATSCVFGSSRRGFKAWMLREWQALDRRALAKIKARYTPELLREEERALLQNGGTTLSRIVRRVGTLVKRRKGTPKGPSSASSPHAPA